MTPRHPLVILILACVAIVSPRALAQVRVTAQASSDRVYVGDGIRIDVEVAGSKNPSPPTPPVVAGLLIELAGSQDTSRRQIMIVNGRRTEDVFEGYVFSFRVLALQAGRYTIPPISVSVDGKDYQTNPIQLTAMDAGNVEGFKLELKAQKDKVYVGEPVKVRLTWYLTGVARGGTFTMPSADGAFELLEAPAPPNSRGNEFTLFGKPAIAIQGTGTLEGEQCETISVDRVFVARRPGRVTLGPIRLAFDLELSRGIFGRAERKVIASNPLEFEVEPLPAPTPPGFNGLIGAYSIATRASPTDVHVGDPISLTVVVRGPEPLDAVPALDLSTLPGFDGFRLSTEPMLPNVQQVGNGRAVVFTTTLRAERDSLNAIPAVELPYFDVERGAYGVARSEPIPIKVAPTTEVGLGPDPQGVQQPETPAQGVAGLSPIARSVDSLIQASTNVGATLRSPLVITMLGLPALAYLASLGLLTAQRRAARDPLGRRRRSAAGRASRRLSRAGDGPAKIGAALRGYAADWFGFPEAGATSAECAQRVRDAAVPSAGAYADLLDRCDAALYAGSAARVTCREATETLRSLARELEEKQ